MFNKVLNRLKIRVGELTQRPFNRSEMFRRLEEVVRNKKISDKCVRFLVSKVLLYIYLKRRDVLRCLRQIILLLKQYRPQLADEAFLASRVLLRVSREKLSH
jgi:hypothetical protein